jgi:hypothetical protein
MKHKAGSYDPATDDGSQQRDLPPDGATVEVVVRNDGTGYFDKRSGTGQKLQFKMEVCAGEPGEGTYLWYNVPLDSQYTDTFSGRLLAGLGFDLSESFDWEPEDLVGKTARVVVKHETYEGKVRARVASFVVPDEPSADAPSDSDDDDDVPF